MTTQIELQRLADQYARNVTSRMGDAVQAMPHDITERLRAARMQAVAARKQPRVAVAVEVAGGPSMPGTVLGWLGGSSDFDARWWAPIATLVPLAALIIAMVAMNVMLDEDRANEVAEIDAALLTDDLPPQAYADPGFLQFLKASPADSAP